MGENDIRAMPSEEWRAVDGYEDLYQVSSLGRVRSIRATRRTPALIGRVDRYGYPTVLLSRDTVEKRFKIHRLVCRAFNGPSPSPELIVGHLDGSRTNNVPSNLAWITHAQNCAHKILHGTNARSPRHPQAMGGGTFAHFTQEGAASVREARKAGASERALARRFGCAQSTIHRLLSGERYRGC